VPGPRCVLANYWSILNRVSEFSPPELPTGSLSENEAHNIVDCSLLISRLPY
jgi:hypothetical protein